MVRLTCLLNHSHLLKHRRSAHLWLEILFSYNGVKVSFTAWAMVVGDLTVDLTVVTGGEDMLIRNQ